MRRAVLPVEPVRMPVAFKAIKMNGSATVNWEKCMGCGVCTGQCPTQAIALIRDERKGVPMDVWLLT
ncbi:MAG: 4Fe-4S binding protein [Desulfobacterales bacterium]|nr:4Fe-4S binding protein [Desulfobacterales bacterium]